MKELFKKWLEKRACKHKWEIVATTSYPCYNVHLLVCTECGKITKQTV